MAELCVGGGSKRVSHQQKPSQSLLRSSTLISLLCKQGYAGGHSCVIVGEDFCSRSTSPKPKSELGFLPHDVFLTPQGLKFHIAMRRLPHFVTSMMQENRQVIRLKSLYDLSCESPFIALGCSWCEVSRGNNFTPYRKMKAIYTVKLLLLLLSKSSVCGLPTCCDSHY